MTIKLPVEVERFAQEYFAAESRAASYSGGRKSFRSIDKKNLARSCKALFETGAIESMFQLTKDLANYKPGYSAAGHTARLASFAQTCGITYRKTTPVQVKKPKPEPKPLFNLKAALHSNFHEALRSGFSLKVLQDQVTEVFEEHSAREQKESRVSALVRETGLSRVDLIKIANAMQGITA